MNSSVPCGRQVWLKVKLWDMRPLDLCRDANLLLISKAKWTFRSCLLKEYFQLTFVLLTNRVWNSGDTTKFRSSHASGASKATEWECRGWTGTFWGLHENFKLHSPFQSFQKQRDYCQCPQVSAKGKFLLIQIRGCLRVKYFCLQRHQHHQHHQHQHQHQHQMGIIYTMNVRKIMSLSEI